MNSYSKSRIRLLIIPVFLAAIFVPTIATFAPIEKAVYSSLGRTMSTGENRNLSERPAIPNSMDEAAHFAIDFELFWNDHFGFRYSLIRANNLLNTRFFNDSGQLRVLVGKNGWLYYKGNDVVKYTEGRDLFTEEELTSLITRLESNSNRLAAAGIEYIVFIVPNKHSIYPEYLPPSVNPSDRTRLDQLLETLDKNSRTNINVVDVRAGLAKQKSIGQLYEKTGTHWTDLGALFATQMLVDKIQYTSVDVEALRVSDYRIGKKNEGPFDLSDLLGIDLPSESVPDVVMKTARQVSTKYFLSDTTGVKSRSELIRIPFRVSADSTGNPIALVYRDSFFSRVERFFSPRFDRVDYYWQHNIDWSVVDSVQPDLVVQEFVERVLMTDLEL